jgi:signal transduction histidine kinase
MARPTPGFSLPGGDRLAELGQLAGALVHELKNPLGAILLNCELLDDQAAGLALPKAQRERLLARVRRVHDGARNLQGIVQSFLAWARPARGEPAALDVNALLSSLLEELAEVHARNAIGVSFHPDPALASVPGDRIQLRSAFLNVLANAADALAERADGRRLVVLTRSAPGVVRVVIANNGPPLPERVAAHLFEPFVSAKEHGTGLGLAIVRRLVELHRGTVAVASDPDQGVSFTFEFPTALGPAQPFAELPAPTSSTVHTSTATTRRDGGQTEKGRTEQGRRAKRRHPATAHAPSKRPR